MVPPLNPCIGGDSEGPRSLAEQNEYRRLGGSLDALCRKLLRLIDGALNRP